MNQFLPLERLEFIVTNRCNSNCRHCLIQPQKHNGETMDARWAQEILTQISGRYPLISIMTFGGEPTLAMETTLALHRTAKSLKIPHRHLITNGAWIKGHFPIKLVSNLPATQADLIAHFKSKEIDSVGQIARDLSDAGVNDVEISFDALHAEFINPCLPILAAQALLTAGIINVRLVPRWVGSPQKANRWNLETQKLLVWARSFGIETTPGEISQPRGNALIHFSDEYGPLHFNGTETCKGNPNLPDLENIRSLCISPTKEIIFCKNIILGEVEPDSILSLLAEYSPHRYLDLREMLTNGIGGLIALAKENGVILPAGPFYSLCDACLQYRKLLHITKSCDA